MYALMSPYILLEHVGKANRCAQAYALRLDQAYGAIKLTSKLHDHALTGKRVTVDATQPANR